MTVAVSGCDLEGPGQTAINPGRTISPRDIPLLRERATRILGASGY
jgi:hypothetical protein